MLLLSIRPNFADRILDGSKKVEFRRRHPRQIELGTRMLIYASSPVRALIGTAVVVEIVEASPEEVWDEYKAVGGIDHEQFSAYYEECDRAIVIRLSKPVRLAKPITLDDLRSKWPGFHPPQQFAYMSSDRVRKLSRVMAQV